MPNLNIPIEKELLKRLRIRCIELGEFQQDFVIRVLEEAVGQAQDTVRGSGIQRTHTVSRRGLVDAPEKPAPAKAFTAQGSDFEPEEPKWVDPRAEWERKHKRVLTTSETLRYHRDGTLPAK